MPVARRSLLGAALGVLLAAGCGSPGDGNRITGTVPLFGGTVPPGRPAVDLASARAASGDRVAMIGDSITVASAPLLREAATELGIDLTIDAEVGRRIAGGSGRAGTDVLADMLHTDFPDLVVIALGTNDLSESRTVEEYGEMITVLLTMVPAEVPVVWVNTYLEHSPESSGAFNEALLETLRRRGNAAIGGWAAIAPGDGVLSDGVHPTDAGEEHFSGLVIDQVTAWLS